MPVFRATMLFEGLFSPAAGFTESWDFERSTNEEASDVALAMVQQRRQHLSENWKIPSLRMAVLSPLGGPDDCKLKQTYVSVLGCIINQLGVLGPTDTPWTSVFVDIGTREGVLPAATPPRPRRYQMRGIPDSWWDGATQSLIPAAGASVAIWMQHIIQVVKAGAAKPNAGCTGLALQPYTIGCVRRISSRRIGRPFFQLRGRQSSKCPPGQIRVKQCVPVPPPE